MKAKRFFAIILMLLTATGVMSGCGVTSRDENTIIIWTESLSTQVEAMDEFIEYFNESNDFGYKMEYRTQDTLAQQLKYAIQSNNAPDLVMWPRWETATYASGGIIQDISQMAAADGINLGKYNAEALREVTQGNKVYGLPVDVDAWGMWINLDVLDAYNSGKSGNDLAKIPATWAELKDTAVKLTKKSGNTVTHAGLDVKGLRGQLYTLIQTAGVNYVNETTSPPTVNMNNQASRDALTFVKELQDAGIYSAGLEGSDKFINGYVAMVFGSTYFQKEIELSGMTAPRMKFIGVPKQGGYNGGADGQVSGVIGGYSLSMPGASIDTAKSWKVIKWWNEKQNMQKFLEIHNLFPAHNDYTDAAYIEGNAVFETLNEILPTYKVRPVVKGYSNFEGQVVFSVMDEFRIGQVKTVTDAINRITTNGNDIFMLENL